MLLRCVKVFCLLRDEELNALGMKVAQSVVFVDLEYCFCALPTNDIISVLSPHFLPNSLKHIQINEM